MNPDDYVMISGIQHFAFCKRQWALIHLEQLWQENFLTAKGREMHKNADNPYFSEVRGDVLVSRAVPLVSHSLKVTGVADVVEFHRSEYGVNIAGREGFWSVFPIEYKVGKKKEDVCDAVQLCAQAICLEEMFETDIFSGWIFYGKTRRRVEVIFDDALRDEVSFLVSQMYALYESGQTPRAVYQRGCESCSMIDVCLPKIFQRNSSVDSYFSSMGDFDA